MSKKAKKSRATSSNDLYRSQPTTNDLEKLLYVELPIPPSVNMIYMNTRGGGKRLTRDAQAWFNVARARIMEQVEDQEWHNKTEDKWLTIDLAFFFPDRRIRDNHNCYKILMDVLETEVFENDYYVMPGTSIVEFDSLLPRVECIIKYQDPQKRKESIDYFEHIREKYYRLKHDQRLFE